MKTIDQAFREFRYAMENFLLELCYALKIPEMLGWISKKLKQPHTEEKKQ